jgi:hypothetical protein
VYLFASNMSETGRRNIYIPFITVRVIGLPATGLRRVGGIYIFLYHPETGVRVIDLPQTGLRRVGGRYIFLYQPETGVRVID